MGVAFDIISGRLQIDNSRWLSVLQSSSTAFGRFINGINQAAQVAKRGLDNLANALTGIATAAAAAGAAGIKMGADYEQSMARVRAVTGATGAEFQKLDAYAKKLGIDTVYSAKDAADGMAYLAQGGYKVNQIMGAMRPVMDLAATAQVGVADASRILVNIMESMRIHVDELPHAVDVLAKAMVSGGNDMLEFGEAFKYVGPVARAAGVSLEQTAAVLQLLGKAGINASMGGTALKGMLSILSEEAPKLRKDFASLGIAVYDAQGKLKPLPDVVDQFNAALKDANRQGEATKLIMGDIGLRAGPGFLSLMELGGDAIRKLSGEMKNSAGLANKIAEMQIATLKNKWSQLVESLTTLGISFTGHISGPLQKLFQNMNDWISDNAKTVNDVLAVAWDTFAASVSQTVTSVVELSQAASPALQLVWDKITGVASAIKGLYERLSPTQQSLLVTVGTLTALGMGIGRLGGRIPMIGELVVSLGKLINPMQYLGGAVSMLRYLLGSLMALALSPLGITIGVVAGAVYGLYMAFNKAYESSAAFRAGVEKIKAAVVGFIAYTREKIGAWVDEHRAQFDRIADKASQVWETMKRGVAVLAAYLGDKLGEAIKAISGGSLQDLDDAFGAVGKAAGLVMDALEGLVDFMDGDGRRLGMVALEVAKIWNTAMASILDAIANVIETAGKAFDNPLLKAAVKATLGEGASAGLSQFSGAAAFGLRANANGLRSQANLQGIGADFMRAGVRASDKARNDDINRRRSNKQYADLAAAGAASGGNAFYEAFFDPQKIEEQERIREKVRLEFDQENAAAEGKVEAEQDQKVREQATKADTDKRAAMSGSDTTGNKAATRQAKTIASGVQKDVGSLFQFAAKNRPKTRQDALDQHGQIQQIQQFGMAVMQQFANIANLEGDARKKAVQDAYTLQQQYQDLVEAFKSGKLTTKEFGAMLKKATKDVGDLGDQAKKAGDAEKELADEEIAKLNAQGIFTPQQQQQAQQQMQQAQQMIQQQVLGPLQQMLQQQAQATGQGAQDLANAALTGQGIGDLQDAIANAKTPQEALKLTQGYLKAQAAMTLMNIQNVASTNDPIIGSFGGQFQGANNLQYILSTGGNPLVDFYHDLIKQIDAIDAKLKSMPHMASGGIVTGPTTALIGEAGPEAILPLGKFGQWFASAMGAFGNAIGGVIGQIIPMGALQNAFGNPIGIFGNQAGFGINPGGFSVNPLGLNMGNLGAFDSMFGAASMILNQQADLGNTAALGILDQWGKVQQTAEDAIGFMRQHRRIDLGGHGGYGGRLSGYGESMYRNGYGSPHGSGFGGGGHTFVMNMYPSGLMTQADISRAFDQFENEARRRGADGLGRSRLRSSPFGQMTRGPLAPAGVPH